MNEPSTSIHVSQVGENWEVESDGATLGQAETQPEAVDLARELARNLGIHSIQIHSSEGRVEKEIHVSSTI